MIKPEHVGKRLLMRKGWQSTPDEVKIIEISPDERHFKYKVLTDQNPSPRWDSCYGWLVESILPSKEFV